MHTAHVTKNKKQNNVKKKELKQTNASVSLVRSRFKIREDSPNGTRMTMEEGFVRQMPQVRPMKWKMVTAKVVTVMRWCVQDEVNQEESKQDEVDETKKASDSTDHR